MLRTKLMNQPTDKKLYDGFIDCAVKTVKEGGPLSLYRGFIPIWARFAPQATIQVRLYWLKYVPLLLFFVLVLFLPTYLLQLLTIETMYNFLGFKGI